MGFERLESGGEVTGGMNYLFTINYDLDYTEEQILDFVRMIRGVEDVVEYVESEEVSRIRSQYQDMADAQRRRADDYRKDVTRLQKELKTCLERPQTISEDPDYVELVKLRRENEALQTYKKVMELAQKDGVNIKKYFKAL